MNVPGFSDRVKICVGDIERGLRAKRVRISTEADETLYEGAGVGKGAEMKFQYGGHEHAVSVERYEDHTFGTDYAHLVAQVTKGFTPPPVKKKEVPRSGLSLSFLKKRTACQT